MHARVHNAHRLPKYRHAVLGEIADQTDGHRLDGDGLYWQYRYSAAEIKSAGKNQLQVAVRNQSLAISKKFVASKR